MNKVFDNMEALDHGFTYLIESENRETSKKDIEEYLNIDCNEVSVNIQNGAIKEAGVNGIQITELIIFCKGVLNHFNEKFPSTYNKKTLDSLTEAIAWQKQRTIDRQKRNVEGINKE